MPMTSAGSRPASSAARRVRNSHRARCESGCRWPGGSAAMHQLPVPVVAGAAGLGGPDRVQDGQVVGVGQVPPPGLGGGQLGAVAAQDVGEHGDRLARVSSAHRRAGGLVWQESLAFAADAVVAVQFGGGPGAGLRVGRRSAW